MGAENQAEVRVAIRGAEEAAGQLRGVGNAAGEAGSKGKTAFGEFKKELGDSIKSTASDIVKTITVLKTISFAEAMRSSKDYQSAVSRMAIGAGQSISTVDFAIRQLSDRTRRPIDQTAAWVTQIKNVTKNYDYAVNSASAFATEADSSGKSLEEMAPLADVLFQIGVKGEDAAKFIATLHGEAAALGNVGGVGAIRDRFVELSDQLSFLNMQMDGSKEKVGAFFGSFGKGLNEKQQTRVQSQALSLLQNTTGIEYYVGHKITDENGNVADPIKTLKEYRAALIKQFGKKGASRAFRNFGGAQLEAAMMRADFDKILGFDHAISNDEGKRRQEALHLSPAGQDAENARRARNAELGVGDDMSYLGRPFQSLLADHPLANYVLGTFGIGAGVKAAGFGLKQLAKRGGIAAGEQGAKLAAKQVVQQGLKRAGRAVLGEILGGMAEPLMFMADFGSAWVSEGAELGHRRNQIAGESEKGFQTTRLGRARAIIRAGERSTDTASYVHELGPALVAQAKNDPVLQSVAQGVASGQIDLSTLPNDMRAAIKEAFESSTLSIQVINATGGPVLAVQSGKAAAAKQ